MAEADGKVVQCRKTSLDPDCETTDTVKGVVCALWRNGNASNENGSSWL
jgi:hypothetical protein